MAQQDTPAAAADHGPQAVRRIVNDDRSHFLQTTTKWGVEHGMVIDQSSSYNVIVWGTESSPIGRSHAVIAITVGNGSFSLHEHLSPDHARLLARALTMAADHSEDLAASAFAAERERQLELEGGAA